jgi:hypothetical protein
LPVWIFKEFDDQILNMEKWSPTFAATDKSYQEKVIQLVLIDHSEMSGQLKTQIKLE